MPIQAFLDKSAGENRSECFVNIDDPPIPPPPRDWRIITAAIHRGKTYVVEGDTQVSKASVSFTQDKPGEGSYEIRSARGRETGRTVEVREVTIDETDENWNCTPLKIFPLRFAVRTVGNNRGLMWLIGMEAFTPQGEPEPSGKEFIKPRLGHPSHNWLQRNSMLCNHHVGSNSDVVALASDREEVV